MIVLHSKKGSDFEQRSSRTCLLPPTKCQVCILKSPAAVRGWIRVPSNIMEAFAMSDEINDLIKEL